MNLLYLEEKDLAALVERNVLFKDDHYYTYTESNSIVQYIQTLSHGNPFWIKKLAECVGLYVSRKMLNTQTEPACSDSSEKFIIENVFGKESFIASTQYDRLENYLTKQSKLLTNEEIEIAMVCAAFGCDIMTNASNSFFGMSPMFCCRHDVNNGR